MAKLQASISWRTITEDDDVSFDSPFLIGKPYIIWVESSVKGHGAKALDAFVKEHGFASLTPANEKLRAYYESLGFVSRHSGVMVKRI